MLINNYTAAWFKDEINVDGRSSSGIQTPHSFGWRDAYDVLIKWRQYSEAINVE